MTRANQANSTRQSLSWPVVVLVVILIGVGGIFLVRAADTENQQTLGTAMLTAALVAGPFLVAEVLLRSTESKRENTLPMVRSGDLAGRDLGSIDLSDRYLRRRSFCSARLSGALLDRADLSEATFDDARLTGASLDHANLRGASLKSSSCFEASFRGANLTNADFRWANLKKADLRKSELIDADLENADLRGADLRDSDLRGVNLQGARYSDSTRFPASLQDEADIRRLGLCRHPDEIVVAPSADRLPRFVGMRSLVRSAAVVGAAAMVVVGIQVALPDRTASPTVTTPRVSGVVLERPYYRISGTAENVSVIYRNDEGQHTTRTFNSLPATIVVGPFDETTPLDIAVEILDSGTVRCEIYVGGEVASQAGSAGPGGIASCAIS